MRNRLHKEARLRDDRQRGGAVYQSDGGQNPFEVVRKLRRDFQSRKAKRPLKTKLDRSRWVYSGRWAKKKARERLRRRFISAAGFHLPGASEILAGINVLDSHFAQNMESYHPPEFEPVPPIIRRGQITELLESPAVLDELVRVADRYGVSRGTVVGLVRSGAVRRSTARQERLREENTPQGRRNVNYSADQHRLMYSAFCTAMEHYYAVTPVPTGLEGMNARRKINMRTVWHDLPQIVRQLWEEARWYKTSDPRLIEEVYLSRI